MFLNDLIFAKIWIQLSGNELPALLSYVFALYL